MYPYEFTPKQKAINFTEVFVVMPFGKKYDNIYDNLIVLATNKANEKLSYSGLQALRPYRTKEDIRTTSGWINVLEHLLTAQVVLGVLTDNNANVFYELGIAHATEPISRQVLIANKGYERQFDTKDLIYYEYENNLEKSIEPLSIRITDAIKTHKIEQEKNIHRARMLLGPYEFEIVMIHGKARSFVLHTSPKARTNYESTMINEYGDYMKGCFERHVFAVSNLCSLGLLGLNTSSNLSGAIINVQFSYHWTELGNSVLHLMKLITPEELKARRENLPAFF